MDISRILSTLIQATLITLIYLFIFLTAKVFLWEQPDTFSGRRPVNNAASGLSWNNFVEVPAATRKSNLTPVRHKVLSLSVLCNTSVVKSLSGPRLTTEEYDWCLWAQSPTGGNVNQKTLWGKLASREPDKWKYRHLQCERLHNREESCNDVEGDEYIKRWRQTRIKEAELTCDTGKRSRQVCYKNNSDTFCELTNVMIDFRKFHNGTRVNRFGETLNIRTFEKDFISTDCLYDSSVTASSSSVVPISHLCSTKISFDYCDVVLPGPVLLYSHEYLENFGHTLSDMMYVWQMLWLSKLASSVGEVDLLNVDGIFGDRNTNEQESPFFLHYRAQFRRLLMAREFKNSRVCVGKLYLPPRPNDFHLFHLWHADDKCGLKMGPSSLFQRYNLHIRGLLTTSGNDGNGSSGNGDNSESVSDGFGASNDKVFRIVVIVRNERVNLGGTSSRTSRLILNLREVRDTLEGIVQSIMHALDVPSVDIVYQDFSEISYREQLHLIDRTNLLVGMHGAGIPQSLHMSIGGGRDNCCGVIEMFPAGEFSIIRAYGNMARRMGLRYDRIDISANESHSYGAKVPVDELAAKVLSVARQMHNEPTCILPTVVEDPFLE